MKRRPILESLKLYEKTWATGAAHHRSYDQSFEKSTLELFYHFIEGHEDCFERHHPSGHITGSAMVCHPGLERVLLTLHGKLNLWLQLGGHADGSPAVHEVALRETEEESGLKDVWLLDYERKLFPDQSIATALPFDIDRHLIPARKDEPEHYHYDIRYAVIVNPEQEIQISEESKDLRWFSLDEARSMTDELSMHRQFDKIDYLRSRLL